MRFALSNKSLDIMSRTVHVCSLPPKDTSGFPKLPPNASLGKRLIRKLRMFTALNPNHAKCKDFFRNKSSEVSEAKKFARSPYFYVIHPFSKCNSILEVLFFVAWIYSIVTDPIAALQPFNAVKQFDYMVDNFVVLPLQRILIISFFFSGYVDEENRQVIIEPRRIIWRYLKTYFFFDVTAAELATRIVTKTARITSSDIFYYQVQSVIKITSILCYYVRLGTVLSYFRGITQHLLIPKVIRSVIVHFLKLFIILHLITCMLYAIPKTLYLDHWPEQSWLVQAGIQYGSDTNLCRKYAECFLVAVCYLFGASHGMYEVSIPNEQLSLSIITLVGRLYTLFLLADLLKLFGIVNVSESNYEQQLSRLDEYITSKNLPDNLRKRLLKFYEYKLRKHCFNETEIFSTLSEHLRTELFLFAARNLIRRLYIFKTLPKPTLASIISLMKLETYSPKDVIIKIGATVDDVYFISSGTVAVVNAAGMELCHLEDSDEFGVISNMTDAIQMYQIEAVEPTEIFHMHKGIFISLLEEHADVVVQLNDMAEKRMDKLNAIQENIIKGGSTFLADLRSGKILESFNKRPLIAE